MNAAATISGLGFVGWAGLSLLWSPTPWEGGALLALLVCGWAVGQWAQDLRRLWVGLCAAASLNLLFAFLEFALWWDGGDFRWYGLAGSSGRLGAVMAMGFAAALAYRIWWFLPIGAVGLLYASSRGALAAAGIATMIYLWRSHRATAMCLALLSILAGLVLRDDAGASLIGRLGIWQDAINHLTLWGHGLGSFAAEYASWPRHTAPVGQLSGHAYNDILELIFDLGVGSAFAWACIVAAFERHGPDRLICVTFAILGLAYFPLWVVGPAFTMSLAHLANHGAKLWRAGVLQPHTT